MKNPSGPSHVRTAARGSAAFLRRSGDVINTYKHHTRRHGQTTAVVSEAWIDDRNAARFTIKWTAPDGTTGTRDALDLAQAAVSEWLQFFSIHGLDVNAA
ncbi:hypothetical protein ACIBSV_01375 [Embleya sp. NPDC050154]|uniref:hypothetical protein n=1 Tax=Embleya sp. NPDC050154 TaxID=3363988 RepID=UPI00379E821E